MSEQLQFRRGSATAISTFTGAQGEIVFDTTNNRLVAQDGSTAGGFAAAKLAETQTTSRSQANDANYAMAATDRAIAFIAITAARTVSLVAASAFQQGATLFVFDESGGCSATNTIAINRAGSDTIDGATSVALSVPYGFAMLQSNGANKWTLVASTGASATTPNMDGTAAIGSSLSYARADHTHPTNTSRAPLASPTFTGTPAAPTASAGTNTTQLATTAFVAASFAPLASPALTGAPTAPTAFGGTNSTQVATTAFVATNYAALAGATFTGALAAAAGTTTSAPLKFQSGTNLTTAAAGALEYDGNVFYASVAASERGVVPAEQFITLSSGYTLTSQTAAQALFNTTTNGAITLATGNYQFECLFSLTGMSASSGTFGFALGGTATGVASWTSLAMMASPASTATAPSMTFNNSSAANTALTASSTATAGSAFIKGFFHISGAGTVIPQVSLSVAAAALVTARSYFKIAPLGSSSTYDVGNWS